MSVRCGLQIGTDWSEETAALEAALARPEVAAEVEARFVQVRVCYETCQRWLRQALPALHHGPLPQLAITRGDGALLAEASARDLDFGDTDALLEFLVAGRAAKK